MSEISQRVVHLECYCGNPRQFDLQQAVLEVQISVFSALESWKKLLDFQLEGTSGKMSEQRERRVDWLVRVWSSGNLCAATLSIYLGPEKTAGLSGAQIWDSQLTGFDTQGRGAVYPSTERNAVLFKLSSLLMPK